MNPSSVLVEAYKRGRAWIGTPEFAELLNLDEGKIRLMRGDEADAKLLIRSLQMSDANYTPLVLAFHKRLPDYDGSIGPATQALVDIPRCPLPDAPPPPNASFHYDDPGLQRAVETMQANALAGRGSWLDCDPDRPGVYGLRVRIANPDKLPTNWKRYKKEIFESVSACYAEIGCALRYIFAESGDCEILKLIQSLSGTIIGWNEFPQANTCNQTINGRLDTGYDPSDWRYQANLEAHETGHGCGANHTRGHIMNPSILLIWPLTWRGGPSESDFVRWFTGKPITDPAPPPPPPGVLDTFTLAGIKYEIRKAGGTNPIEV